MGNFAPASAGEMRLMLWVGGSIGLALLASCVVLALHLIRNTRRETELLYEQLPPETLDRMVRELLPHAAYRGFRVRDEATRKRAVKILARLH